MSRTTLLSRVYIYQVLGPFAGELVHMLSREFLTSHRVVVLLLIAKLFEWRGLVILISLCVGGLKHVVDTLKNMVLWVFGYGSLLWKAGFEYDEKMIGYIKGYRRVFHQGGALSYTIMPKICKKEWDIRLNWHDLRWRCFPNSSIHVLNSQHRSSRHSWIPWTCCHAGSKGGGSYREFYHLYS